MKSAGNLPFQQLTTHLPDGPATIMRPPGVPQPGRCHEAIFAAARRVLAGRAFVVGPAAAPTALWAARSGATVLHWTDSAAEAEAVAATFRANHLPAPQGHVGPDCTCLEPGQCDMALVHLPRGRDLQGEYLRTAAAMVREGAKVVFVGARNEGVKSALADAQEIYGRAGIVARKGGYHAGMAYRPPGEVQLPTAEFRTYDIVVRGQPARLVSCTGAFAADRLDAGAAALIAGMRIEPDVKVLDLGCGTGLVALEAARRGGRVEATDVSSRAVASARRTLSANGYSRVTVHLCSGAATVPEDTIDVVVTNPPFHRGHDVNFEVSQLFVDEAARVLKVGGRIYLVANAFLDYGRWLRSHFRDVEVAWQNKQFHVWSGRKF
ncbi:MAG: class I SAM-dependent methyltransferase [Anaerolineae bacterium]